MLALGRTSWVLVAFVLGLIISSCRTGTDERMPATSMHRLGRCPYDNADGPPLLDRLAEIVEWYRVESWTIQTGELDPPINRSVRVQARLFDLESGAPVDRRVFAHSSLADDAKAALSFKAEVIVGFKAEGKYGPESEPYAAFGVAFDQAGNGYSLGVCEAISTTPALAALAEALKSTTRELLHEIATAGEHSRLLSYLRQTAASKPTR